MTTDTATTDELDEYMAVQMRDPLFRAAFRRAVWQHLWASPAPLCIDGRKYARRRAARKRRRP